MFRIGNTIFGEGNQSFILQERKLWYAFSIMRRYQLVDSPLLLYSPHSKLCQTSLTCLDQGQKCGELRAAAARGAAELLAAPPLRGWRGCAGAEEDLRQGGGPRHSATTVPSI